MIRGKKIIMLNPITKKKIKRFKSIKRGYYSLLGLIFLLLLCCVAELLVNSRALIVKYNGEYFFPTYGEMIPGTEFGFDYSYETNYRELYEKFEAEAGDNWVLLPLVPYNEFENDLREFRDDDGQLIFPPHPPMFNEGHFLGTDNTGRDIVARLLYGFRIAICFLWYFSFLHISLEFQLDVRWVILVGDLISSFKGS